MAFPVKTAYAWLGMISSGCPLLAEEEADPAEDGEDGQSEESRRDEDEDHRARDPVISGRKNSPTEESAGRSIPPAVSSFDQRLEAEEKAQDGRGHRPPRPRLLPLQAGGMKRTFMDRKPTAMIRATSRFGSKPTLSVAAKAFQANDPGAQPERQGQRRRQDGRDRLGCPFQALRKEHPCGQGGCFFLRDVTAAAIKVATSTRCSVDRRILDPGVENLAGATASATSSAARAKMDRKASESSTV